MTMKEEKERLQTAAYVLALTGARDNEATKEQDKEALRKIRDYLEEIIKLSKGNPGMIIMATAGWSIDDGIQCVKEFDENYITEKE